MGFAPTEKKCLSTAHWSFGVGQFSVEMVGQYWIEINNRGQETAVRLESVKRPLTPVVTSC